MNQRQLKLVISFIVTKASDMKIMSQCESDREAQAGSTYTAHTPEPCQLGTESESYWFVGEL